MSWNFLKPTKQSFTLSFVSLLGPIFIPKRPEGEFDNILDYLKKNPEVKKINYYLEKEWSKNQLKYK